MLGSRWTCPSRWDGNVLWRGLVYASGSFGQRESTGVHPLSLAVPTERERSHCKHRESRRVSQCVPRFQRQGKKGWGFDGGLVSPCLTVDSRLFISSLSRLSRSLSPTTQAVLTNPLFFHYFHPSIPSNSFLLVSLPTLSLPLSILNNPFFLSFWYLFHLS